MDFPQWGTRDGEGECIGGVKERGGVKDFLLEGTTWVEAKDPTGLAHRTVPCLCGIVCVACGEQGEPGG